MLAQVLPEPMLAWMLTYLLHSTLLLGFAWLASKPLARWSVVAEEAFWKLALVGALVTASLQLAAGWEPVAGRWQLADLDVLTNSKTAEVGYAAAEHGAVPAAASRVEDLGTARLPTAGPMSKTSLPSLPALALGGWALGALLLLAAHGAWYLRLRRRLRPRPLVVGGDVFSQLRGLTRETGLGEDVRLTCSTRVPVPLALGIRRSEICVPPRALVGLPEAQREGMLAHELAHLVRRDPLWLVVAQAVSCLFFFQPLNWVARRRLREISEMLSDEWAVSRTGRPLSLAGCLAEVAGWSSAGRPLPVPGMADRPSNLARRIRRLLDESRSPDKPARRWWLGAAMALLVIGVAAAAPAVSANRAEPATSAEEPAGAEAPAEPAELADAQSPEPAERAEWVEEESEKEFAEPADDLEEDYDFEEDYDLDLDLNVASEIDLAMATAHNVLDSLDVDLDLDVDAALATALSSMNVALGALDLDLASLADPSDYPLTRQEREALETEMERAGEQIERTLAPRMEQLSRELSEKMSRLQESSGEMRRLQGEMERLAERMRPSEEELARIHAEMEKLHQDRRLSAVERQELARRAREMAQKVRPTEEQRRQMRQLGEEMRKVQRETAERFRAEHFDEILRAQREMREEIAREMQAVREEVRRSREKQRLRLQEERREHRKEIREERSQEHEVEETKPPEN